MQALTFAKYGPPRVLQFGEAAVPIPADDGVLIRVHVTTVNRTDCATVGGIPRFARLATGLFRPRQPIPGSEFAGTVEAVGKRVSSLKPGERVCGFADLGAGAHAELLAVKAACVVPLPGKLPFAEAVGMEGFHYAWSVIRRISLPPGAPVLVNGASGAIGSAAVQLLAHLGAHVTATCPTSFGKTARALGAARVINVETGDFTREAGGGYRFVFDAVGKSSFRRCRRLLARGGVYVSTDLGFLAQNLFLPILTTLAAPFLGRRRSRFPLPTDIPGSLRLFVELVGQGKFKAVVDRQYPFGDIIEAYGYAASGRKVGNLVVMMPQAARRPEPHIGRRKPPGPPASRRG
jgi:NADPH:quinone reductase-like Zn-dependent oxidoreductase